MTFLVGFFYANTDWETFKTYEAVNFREALSAAFQDSLEDPSFSSGKIRMYKEGPAREEDGSVVYAPLNITLFDDLHKMYEAGYTYSHFQHDCKTAECHYYFRDERNTNGILVVPESKLHKRAVEFKRGYTESVNIQYRLVNDDEDIHETQFDTWSIPEAMNLFYSLLKEDDAELDEIVSVEFIHADYESGTVLETFVPEMMKF